MRRKIRWLLLQLRRLMSSPSRKARRLAAKKAKEQMSENFNPPKQVVDSDVEQMLAQFENQTATIALEQKLQQIRHEAAQEAMTQEVPHCAFCGADESKAEVLLKGKEAYICGTCATNCERLTREAYVRKRLKGARMQELEAENAALKQQLDGLLGTLKGLLPPT